MQYALKVFETEDHYDFRVVDRDGEPWFVLSDVCRSIGIGNPSDAARRLDDDEKMTLDLTEGHSGVRGGARRMNLINESGLYSLILRSDNQKPSHSGSGSLAPSYRKSARPDRFRPSRRSRPSCFGRPRIGIGWMLVTSL